MAPQYADPFEVVKIHPQRLTFPTSWREPKRVFVNSVSDLFHKDVPDAFIAAVFGVMASCRRHTFQILTKRAERLPVFFATLETEAKRQGFGDQIAEFCALLASRHYAIDVRDEHGPPDDAWPLPNVWIGPSIENQRMADRRFPVASELGDAGWRVMVSMEPLLSSVSIPPRFLALGRKAWVIVGGESGAKARPFNLAWPRAVVEQCQAAGVPVFVKQLGALPIYRCRTCVYPFELMCRNFGRHGHDASGVLRLHLSDRKGGDMAEWPADLQVRQYPEVRA
jgi:protein gp37